MKIQITDERLLEFEIKPSTMGSAGLDLRACIDKTIVLSPQQKIVVNTGLRLAIPTNWVGIITPRSGLGSRGLVLGNSVGIIDSDYRGDVKLILLNRNEDLGFRQNIIFNIEPMDRVAQLIIVPHYNFQCIEVGTDDLSTSQRGTNGFGSTGI